MGTLIGRVAEVAVSTDDITYQDIGHVTTADQASSKSIAEETNNDSLGNFQGKYSTRTTTLDVTAYYNSSNAGQLLLLEEYYTNEDGIFIRYRPIDDSGNEKQWKYACLLSDIGIGSSTPEVQEISFSVTANGVITYQDQP